MGTERKSRGENGQRHGQSGGRYTRHVQPSNFPGAKASSLQDNYVTKACFLLCSVILGVSVCEGFSKEMLWNSEVKVKRAETYSQWIRSLSTHHNPLINMG